MAARPRPRRGSALAGLMVVAAAAVLALALLGSRPAADPVADAGGDAPAGRAADQPEAPSRDDGDASSRDARDASSRDDPGAVADTDGAAPAHPDDPAAVEPADDTSSDDAGGNARGRLVIHHVGDVNLDRDYVPVLAGGDPAAAWDGARDTFTEAHLVVANLECAASEGGAPQPKQFVFRCDLAALPAMRDAGVDAVSLANNHSGDLGVAAMVESVGNVEAAGLVALGVGRDERDASRPTVVEVAGWRVALLAFGGVVPVPEWTARGDLPGQATGYDPARMAQAVRAARAEADVVVVSVHWGNEGATAPRPEDVDKARAMVEAGADVVFGHHAHRLQPVERVDGVPVFWNLGNFVWPRLSEAGAATGVAEWAVTPNGEVTACLLPFEIDRSGVPRPRAAPRDCT